jgi:glycosyltransferase involved in cell wall biosynthesis
MQHPSQFDRLSIKKQYGLDNHLLITTLGLLSPDKGIHYGIRAYGRFLNESCTLDQREKIVYLIAGQCHPDFVRANGGKEYEEFQLTLKNALEESTLRWCKTDKLTNVNFGYFDVVFLDTFINENILLKLYSATNVMLLPYLNMQQISSGILADTIGAGRVAVTTKFRYALELIHSNKRCPSGIVIGRHARGILVDSGEPSVEQMAEALDYLVFNKDRRLRMERQAHQRGYQMRWYSSAWALLHHIEFIKEQDELKTGRGITFRRGKASIFQKKKFLPTQEN